MTEYYKRYQRMGAESDSRGVITTAAPANRPRVAGIPTGATAVDEDEFTKQIEGR